MRLIPAYLLLCVYILHQPVLSDRWWPSQKAPAAVIKTVDPAKFETVTSPNGKSTRDATDATHNMVQSLAGLAARAVNEGTFDELIWIPHHRSSYDMWYQRIHKRLKFTEGGTFTPWQIVERYRDKGLIKGYVLYSYDYSRDHTDVSVNVATTLCGLYRAILIEEGQESKARELGLEMLADARNKTYRWVFEKYKDRLNRNLLLTAHPRWPGNRDMAIAHTCMVVYDIKDPIPEIMAWLEPLTTIMGWNTGEEADFTGLASRFGHFVTASESAANMPLLSADSESYTPKKIGAPDPAKINYDHGRHFTGFLMSDGDNFRWCFGSFISSKDYWNHPDHGKFPLGWTTSFGHLAQMGPDVIDYFTETRAPQTNMVEQGGGYYYPDNFASERPNREELLARHARNVSGYLRKTGINVLSFICLDIDSPDAMKAYEIFAREMDGLAGMIALQYYPYDGGDGAVYWFPNARGIDIPVVCIKYSLWTQADWPRGGTPKRIARLINEHAEQNRAENKKSYSITSVHAWSTFRKAPDGDEQAENAPIGSTGHRSCEIIQWCIDRLNDSIRVVTPEEIIWRIRMDHNPEQTREAIRRRSSTNE